MSSIYDVLTLSQLDNLTPCQIKKLFEMSDRKSLGNDKEHMDIVYEFINKKLNMNDNMNEISIEDSEFEKYRLAMYKLHDVKFIVLVSIKMGDCSICLWNFEIIEETKFIKDYGDLLTILRMNKYLHDIATPICQIHEDLDQYKKRIHLCNKTFVNTTTIEDGLDIHGKVMNYEFDIFELLFKNCENIIMIPKNLMDIINLK